MVVDIVFYRKGNFIIYKTGVINDDPLGQTHSLTNSEHCSRFKFVLFRQMETDERTNGRHVYKQ